MTEGRRDWQRPLREGWTFSLAAGQVADAVKRKLEWHTARREFWQQRRDELKAKAADAIKVDDPEELEKLLSESLSNSYSSSRPDFGVRLDDEWTKQFTHADKWMKNHQNSIREFASWERMMRFVPVDTLLELERADLVYFAIAAREPGVEE